ncbi:hypothetical protein ACFQ9Z_03730 [Streptomyces sp. NPDC056580]|uniref:hypothetical protein n=1 Tax=Streptomyces sp. NPDC056580 TaxID=3345872 RepID=UPI00369E303C
MVPYLHAVLRNALQHAVREELVQRNVVKLVQVQTPRYRVGQRGLSVAEAKKLLDIVGHSALDVTMNIYAHADMTEKRAALDQLGGLLADDE